MLIGYVSDERYVALPDVPVEIEVVENEVPLASPVQSRVTTTTDSVDANGKSPRPLKTQGVPPIFMTRSSATGKIHVDIPPGKYRVTLNKEGYSAKTVEVELTDQKPIPFRLLKKQLLGYAWPKRVKSGERAELFACGYECVEHHTECDQSVG